MFTLATQELRDLKLLQKQEQKQFQDLAFKNQVVKEQQEKRSVQFLRNIAAQILLSHFFRYFPFFHRYLLYNFHRYLLYNFPLITSSQIFPFFSQIFSFFSQIFSSFSPSLQPQV